MKDLGGRPKVFEQRATVLGSVSKEYHKQLKDLSKRLSKESGKIVSMSCLIRMALEAMFPPENVENTKPPEAKKQLDFFIDQEKPKKKRGPRKKLLEPSIV